MKFKTIFIAFNIILLFSFLFIFFMPLIMLGWEYTKVFWGQNWYLAAAFFVVLLALNTYFLRNWRLFSLLEAEDWHEVKAFLERKIFAGKGISSQNVRILINTYLVLSETENIKKLEQFLKDRKPKLHSAFGMELGLPLLLENNPAAMEGYYSALLDKPKTKNRDWLRWNLVFARMMKKDLDNAKKDLFSLVNAVKEPVLRLLSLYLLDSFRNSDVEAGKTADSGRASLRKAYSRDSWKKNLEREKTNIEILVLMKLVNDSTEWLFGEAAHRD